MIIVDAYSTFDWISWAQLLVYRNNNFKKMQWTSSFNFIPSTIGRGHDRMVVDLKLPMQSVSTQETHDVVTTLYIGGQMVMPDVTLLRRASNVVRM